MNKFITTSYKETQKLGEIFAKNILKLGLKDKAMVLELKGNLGGGKTTFLQGFAKGLGIKDKILSPTFIILKHFKIKPKTKNQKPKFSGFYHFDCYRLNKPEEILELMGFSAQGGPVSGWKEILDNPKNIIAIEWPERVKKILPKDTIKINFKFIYKNKRKIILPK